MFVRLCSLAGERLDCGDDTHEGREGVDTWGSMVIQNKNKRSLLIKGSLD
jgi:hypothetical protein